MKVVVYVLDDNDPEPENPITDEEIDVVDSMLIDNGLEES